MDVKAKSSYTNLLLDRSGQVNYIYRENKLRFKATDNNAIVRIEHRTL
jgi:hypothetical protein